VSFKTPPPEPEKAPAANPDFHAKPAAIPARLPAPRIDIQAHPLLAFLGHVQRHCPECGLETDHFFLLSATGKAVVQIIPVEAVYGGRARVK
jgi:hypothetical protein